METNKNNIGQIIKERLSKFDASPDDLVWTNIHKKLKKKSKRRLLILWFSGLGFLILLSLITINSNLIQKNNDIDQNNTPINVTNEVGKFKKEKSSHTKKINLSNHRKEKSDPKINTKKTNSFITKITNKNSSNITKPNQASLIYKDSVPKTKNINDYTDTSINVSKENVTETLKNKQIAQRNTNENDSIQNTENIENHIKKSRPKNNSDNNVEQNKTKRKWSITPQIIQSFYGTFKPKSSNNSSTNYGLLVNFEATKQTDLRLGVRKLNLQQNIANNDIGVEYLEFPLEVKHALSDKKLNLYVIGGISYFTLLDSKVNNETSTDYINTLSFNIGLGIEYGLSKKLILSIEPKFNYQIKPLPNNDIIKPYIFSVSSGIEFKFN